MTLTNRDLQVAVDYQRQRQLLADAARSPFADYQRQLQLLAQSARPALTDYQRQLQLLAQSARPALTDYQRQLQLLAEAARGALAAHQYNVRFLAGHVARAAAPPGASVPVNRAPATHPATSAWPSAQQLLLRALVLMMGLALLIAYWEEQKANAPAEALVVILGGLKVLYDIDEAIWKNLP